MICSLSFLIGKASSNLVLAARVLSRYWLMQNFKINLRGPHLIKANNIFFLKRCKTSFFSSLIYWWLAYIIMWCFNIGCLRKCNMLGNVKSSKVYSVHFVLSCGFVCLVKKKKKRKRKGEERGKAMINPGRHRNEKWDSQIKLIWHQSHLQWVQFMWSLQTDNPI